MSNNEDTALLAIPTLAQKTVTMSVPESVTASKTLTILDNLNIALSSNQLLSTLNELYMYIKSIHGEKITPTNIVLITSELIQIVEKYNDLTGTQKKMLVINTVKKIVNEQLNTSDEKMALNIIIDHTLPCVINGFIDAINNVFAFTKTIKNKKCGKYLFCQ